MFAGLGAAGAAIAGAAESVHRDSAAAHTVSVLGVELTYPALNAAAALLLLLAAAGAAVLITAIVTAIRLRRGYREFVAGVPVLGGIPGQPGVAVIPGSAPQAFCAGFLHPRIYVSQGTVELLSRDELDAVLQHEREHLQARDPLRLACARVFSRALFFIPALAPLGNRDAELAELRADDAAVAAAGGDRRALALALLAFESGAPAGSGGVAAERVDALLGEPLERRLPALPVVLLSAVVAAALIVTAWRASEVASARATLNLPLLSAQPCMLVLALIPVVVLAAFAATRPTAT